MALENLNCPQFVDFCSHEAFDIHDGADFCFDKRVVGELDLGGFDKKKDDDTDSVEEIIAALSNATNLSKHADFRHQMGTNMADILKATKTPNKKNTNALNEHNCENNKENTAKIDTVSLDSAISSAIEVMSAQSTGKKEKPDQDKAFKPKSSQNELKKLTTKAVTPIQRQRTQSNTSTTSNGSQSESSKQAQSCIKPVNKIVTPVISNTGTTTQNLVKKTLAKVTAAFKVNNKQTNSHLLPSSDSKTNMTDQIGLKAKLSIKKNKIVNGFGVNEAGPIRVDHNKQTKQEPDDIRERSLSPPSNRRCSSVPRTLREKQALKNAGLVIPEIETTEETNDATKKMIKGEIKNVGNGILPTATATLVSRGIKLTKAETMEERRRSRSCNEEIAINKIGLSGRNTGDRNSRRSRNNTGDKLENLTSSQSNQANKLIMPAKANMSPSVKSRQRSADRAPLLPMYQGVKFIPKLAHKYPSYDGAAPPAMSFEDIIKSRPAFVNKKPEDGLKTHNTSINKPVLISTNDVSKKLGGITRSTPGKSASFKHQAQLGNISALKNKKTSESPNEVGDLVNTDSNENHQIKSSHLLNHSQDSGVVIPNRMLNESNASKNGLNLSNLNRKKSETKPMGLLHTELRAMKRHEYDQTLKEKERISNLIKQDLEQEKMRKQQEEIQKIRSQRTFRSRPIKHYKPVELKPSEKPLTEPKSPQLGISFNNFSKHKNTSIDASTLSAANALLDMPVKKINQSNSLTNENYKSTNVALSQDDVRINY